MAGFIQVGRTNRYEIVDVRERTAESIAFEKVWDAVHTTFNSVGNGGDEARNRKEFIEGTEDWLNGAPHKAFFEKGENTYEVSLYELGRPARMDVTCLQGGDFQYAQKDMEEIVGLVNKVLEKNAEPLRLIKQK